MKEKMRVVYIGSCTPERGYADPAMLEEGKLYTILFEDPRGYFLNGLFGIFKRDWFMAYDNIHFGIAQSLPKVGQKFYFRILLLNDNIEIIDAEAYAKKVYKVDDNLYEVETRNSTYYLRVGVPCTPSFFALSAQTPAFGQPYSCQWISLGGHPHLHGVYTSEVQGVRVLAKNLFYINTKNSTYLVKKI